MIHLHLKKDEKPKKIKEKKIKEKPRKKVKKENTKNIYMYSAGYDVNGTIAEKERTFWEKL